MKKLAIHTNVKHFRTVLDWTQDQLAERSSLSRSCIANCEIAATVPDLQSCIAIADAFGVTLDLLVYGPPKSALMLTQARTKRKATIAGLAAIAHLPEQTILRAELGTHLLNPAAMHLVAKALKVSANSVSPTKKRLATM